MKKSLLTISILVLTSQGFANDTHKNKQWTDAKIGMSGGTALGQNANAMGVGSVALGQDSKTVNNWGTAVGYKALSQGQNGTAIGNNTQVTGARGTALGAEAKASGESTTALGTSADASGSYATAIGSDAKAKGQNAIAIGYNAEANANGSVAIGHWSEATEENTFSVGNEFTHRRIVNVAGGKVDNDAVNILQLKETARALAKHLDPDKINTRLNGLAGRVQTLDHKLHKTTKDLKAGIAGAMAMAGLSFSQVAGDRIISVGIGGYQGQNALAVGWSAVNENNRTLFRISTSINTQKDVGYSASVGFRY